MGVSLQSRRFDQQQPASPSAGGWGGKASTKDESIFQHEYIFTHLQHIEIQRSICLRVRHYRVRTKWREEHWVLDDEEGNYLANQGTVDTFDTAVSVDLVVRI